MLTGFLNKWKERRQERAAEKAWLEGQLQILLKQTQPLVPSAPKHPKAALYRHTWKRATVLELIYKRMENLKLAATYSKMAEMAAKNYYDVAPEGPYGKVTLRISPEAMQRLLEKEVQLLLPPEPAPKRDLACIYMGTDENKLVYIGQTQEAPEHRWKEHRLIGSGPFKKGATYVQWRVLRGPVEPDHLDEHESYYIGFYDAYEHGHNESRGNAWQAYERGCQDRLEGRNQGVGEIDAV